MNIYLKSDCNTSLSDIIEEIRMLVCETMRILKENYRLDPDHFILDGDIDDAALFPRFYQDALHTISVKDKNNEYTFQLSSPRYSLMYVWELEDIDSQVDSENIAYEIVSLDKYYSELQDVNTEGYMYIGKYDTLEDALKIYIEEYDEG